MLGDGLGFVSILYRILLLWLPRLSNHMWSAGWYHSKANHLAMQTLIWDFFINCVSFFWLSVNGSPALTSTACCVCRSSCAFVRSVVLGAADLAQHQTFILTFDALQTRWLDLPVFTASCLRNVWLPFLNICDFISSMVPCSSPSLSFYALKYAMLWSLALSR